MPPPQEIALKVTHNDIDRDGARPGLVRSGGSDATMPKTRQA